MRTHPHPPAFIPPQACIRRRQQPAPSVTRRRPPSATQPPPTPHPSPPTRPTRLQLARLRLHLLRATRHHSSPDQPKQNPTPSTNNDHPPSTSQPARRRPVYTSEERRARSDRLREKWADPDWRAAMLGRRREEPTVSRRRDAAKRMWENPEYRARMRASRLGRPAPNKGVSASAVTKLRMSVARKGVTFSEERKRRMSRGKLCRPEGDDWPRRISEGKKGKTKEYFQVRREFRALHRDLKLWSDSYRARYGRLPSASSYDKFVAPMMVFRIRRYLTLRDAIGNDEPDAKKEIISRQ